MNQIQMNNLIDVVKSMKTDIFYITPSMILGTDEQFATLRWVNMPTNVPYPIMAPLDMIVGMTEDNILSMAKSNYGRNPLLELHDKVCNIMENGVEQVISENLELDESFMTGFKKKSAEGASWYIGDGNVSSIYPAMIPALKKDTIRLSYWYSPYNNTTYLAQYTVRKKYYDIYIFMNHLNILH